MNNDDILKKFVGAFPSSFITKFITFHRMMNEKKTVSVYYNEYRS